MAKSGQGHLHTAWVAILLLEVIVLLLGPVLWAVGGWDLIGDKTRLALDAFDAISEPDKKVEAYGKLVSTIGLLAATPIGMIGVGLAFWRTWNQHRDGTTAIRKLDAEAYAKAAEAFAKAVEQLGHKESSIRMGAVLALEALGTSTPRLLSQAIEVFCAYVRESRPILSTLPTDKITEDTFIPPIPTDIQLILDIVERLKREDTNKRIRINLSHVDLRKADMKWTALSGADMSGADIGWADLSNANLSNANLSSANLRNADLNQANLRQANLRQANLKNANLCRADLRAYLDKADLSNADLINADLGGANLSGADLNHANLSHANLRHANLSGADLKGADLGGADLRHAILKETDLSGANLVAKLSMGDLKPILMRATLIDTIFEDTTLPDGRVWTGNGLPPTPVTNA